jgi:hypothetical protein
MLQVGLQAIVGFAMTAAYPHLAKPDLVGAFVVLTGLFMALGEVGPGANIGLLASKLSATPIRGRTALPFNLFPLFCTSPLAFLPPNWERSLTWTEFYGIAAAWGKVGAFVGTYLFPRIIAAAGDNVIKQGQYPFWVSSALCLFSAFVALLFPRISQEMIEEEDERFLKYLAENGYDVRQLGTKEWRESRGLE